MDTRPLSPLRTARHRSAAGRKPGATLVGIEDDVAELGGGRTDGVPGAAGVALMTAPASGLQAAAVCATATASSIV